MFKNILVSLFVCVNLWGCPALQVHETPTTEQVKQDPMSVARESLEQAYATHAALTATLLQNYSDGVITQTEKRAYARKTAQALDNLDKADAFWYEGNLSEVNAYKKLAEQVFTTIQLELAKRAAKEKQ